MPLACKLINFSDLKAFETTIFVFIDRYIEQYGRKSNYNLAAFVMAFISSFGMTVVGAFQVGYVASVSFSAKRLC